MSITVLTHVNKDAKTHHPLRQNKAANRGRLQRSRIPEGWAIDEAGRTTTDPAAALLGNILPMEEHKGYAISVMMDVLSGVLTGSGFLGGVAGPYQTQRRSGCGHLYIALKIDAFRPLSEFETDMENMVDALRSVPLAEGHGSIFYPGEREAIAGAENRRMGVHLPHDTLADLMKLAGKYGLTHVLPIRQDI